MLIPLTKTNITADKKYKKEIINLIQEKGILEISEIKNAEEESLADELKEGDENKTDFHLNRIKTALSFLIYYDESRENLKTKMEKIFNPAITLNASDLDETIADFDFEKAIEKILDIQKNVNLNQSIINESEISLNELRCWENINFAPKETETIKTAKILLGDLPSSVFLKQKPEESPIYKKIEAETGGAFELKIVNEDLKKPKALIVFPTISEQKVREVLSSFNFKESDIPYPDKKPNEAIKFLENTIKKSEAILNKLADEAKKTAGNDLKKLYIISDYLVWEKEKNANIKKIAATKYFFSLDGWIEEKNIHPLELAIADITPDFIVTKLKITARESQPVIIKNKIFEPYEAVTDIYGLPLPNEPDPTPFLAPFFTVFFALALTDAGYGILLMALCWLTIKFLKIPKQKQKLFKLLIYAGAVTTIMGALFGGWFGVTPDTLPESFGPIKNFLMNVQVIDPVKEPLTVMLIAFILGIIQIWVGIFIGAWWYMKKGDWKRSLFDYGVWNFLLAAIIFWLMSRLGIVSGASSIARYILFAGIGAVVLTQGRKSKNPALKFGIGVISLYGLVNYLSDVLSYSRLLALGLATGIIAMVINLIAMIFKDMMPFGWIGWIVAVAILVGGHLFNLVINALGAFIHSGRLQFVEFFPKFMEGGGRRFKPFTRKNNYIRVTN